MYVTACKHLIYAHFLRTNVINDCQSIKGLFKISVKMPRLFTDECKVTI